MPVIASQAHGRWLPTFCLLQGSPENECGPFPAFTRTRRPNTNLVWAALAQKAFCSVEGWGLRERDRNKMSQRTISLPTSCLQISSVAYQLTMTLLPGRNDIFGSDKLISSLVCAEVFLFRVSMLSNEPQATEWPEGKQRKQSREWIYHPHTFQSKTRVCEEGVAFREQRDSWCRA